MGLLLAAVALVSMGSETEISENGEFHTVLRELMSSESTGKDFAFTQSLFEVMPLSEHIQIRS
jgi:hypothetical protein